MAAQIIWTEEQLESLLRERFQITTGFFPGQQDVIKRIIGGERVLAIQHTGWGKSLCYQVASQCLPGITLVFSPLKALMRDQWQKCQQVYGIPSAVVSSDYARDENKTTLVYGITGQFKILFISPERLDNIDWQRYFKRMHISLIVIDEAHCISTWGYHFRPHYRRIIQLITSVAPNTSVLALTATANQRVEEDIQQQLGQMQVVRGSLRRINLHLNVVRLHGEWEKLCYLAEFIQQCQGSGIIYSATRSNAMLIAAFLQICGVNAEYYHAGRSNSMRQQIEQNLLANRYTVVCSTSALGMGLDKPDIRFVIHYHIPGTLLDYYQEIGRAGRDRQPATCTLLYDPVDITEQRQRIRHDKPAKTCYETLLGTLYKRPQGANITELASLTGLSATTIRIVVADLLDQHLIRYQQETRLYTAAVMPTPVISSGQVYVPPPAALPIDYSEHEHLRRLKQDELTAMHQYALTEECAMNYIVRYLGDQAQSPCGICHNCQPTRMPEIIVSDATKGLVTHFLEEIFLPRIEPGQGEQGYLHHEGWALDYLKGSRTGKQIYACKYGRGGPFTLSMVLKAMEIVQKRYPLDQIQGVTSVPSARGSMQVEQFARQIAQIVGKPYIASMQCTRPMRTQQSLASIVDKKQNIHEAFVCEASEHVAGQALLLIDDIYDTGITLREACRVLVGSGARAIYPLVIAKALEEEQ